MKTSKSSFRRLSELSRSEFETLEQLPNNVAVDLRLVVMSFLLIHDLVVRNTNPIN